MGTSVATFARRFVRWEYVPEAVLLVGLSAFFLHQTDAATSAFKSTKAVAIMATVTVGWLAARIVLLRLVPSALARGAVFSVAAAAALWVVVFPAYDNETVIESFPVAAAAAVPTPTTTTPSTISVAERAPNPAPVTTSTTVGTVAVPATTPATPVAAPEPTTTTTTVAPTTTTTTTAPAGPQRVRTGMFRGIDHRASGTVAIYRQPDGRYVIGLEDIDIQPGPDYDLYIVPGEDREDTKGGIRLGDLRGNRGTQFYEVPDGVNLQNGPWTVLVWCQTFAVPVAGSTPS
jgi:hypothetical protein